MIRPMMKGVLFPGRKSAPAGQPDESIRQAVISGRKRFLCRALIAGLVCCIIIFVLCAAQKPEKGMLRITVLDVGKGDCILISKDGSHVLIDAGYAGTSKDVISWLQDR